jgi:hypothetical protein
MRSRVSEAVLTVLVAMLLTILMTWPLAPKAGYVGRFNTNDGKWSIWSTAWVARTLVEDPGALYDANIFYPHRNTLAYSEPNLVAGAMAAPVWWASRNPYLVHNAAVLLSFVLALLGMYLLVRHLTGQRGAAAVAAVSFAFCPSTFSRLPHIQLLMTAGLPFALLALHRFVERPSMGRAVPLGLILSVQALACGYYGIYGGLIVGAGIVFYGVSRGLWRSPRYWALALAAGAVAIAVVLPFFVPYLQLKASTGFGRALGETELYSADWRSYLTAAAWLHRWRLPLLVKWSDVLYPGTVALVLGLSALVMGRKAAPPNGRADDVAFYAGVGALAFWASFGPKGGLYSVLHEGIGLFSWLRAPSRIGLVVAMALSVLAGFVVERLVRNRRHGRALAAGLVVVALADLFIAPIDLREAGPLPQAYRVLAQAPSGPVAEFPFFYRSVDAHRHAEYMLPSTFHWRPLINGYSDYIPPDFTAMLIPISSFPTQESFNILHRLGARYVIFHRELYHRIAWREVTDRLQQYRGYLRPLCQDGTVWLFEIVGWPQG